MAARKTEREAKRTRVQLLARPLLARELAKINQIEATYWEAWERSCGTRTRTVAEERRGRADAIVERIVCEDGCSRASFLAGVQWCIDRRCKLLCLDDADLRQVTVGPGYIAVAIDDAAD